MLFRQLFDPVSSTYTYLLAEGPGGRAGGGPADGSGVEGGALGVVWSSGVSFPVRRPFNPEARWDRVAPRAPGPNAFRVVYVPR